MSENLTLIRNLYAAFASGDVPTVLGSFSPDIVWNEAENFPYADGNPYHGPDAVVAGVFARLGVDWTGFAVEDTELLDAGDTIVMLGRYRATHNRTSQAMNPQVVHVWRVKDGKVVGFQQYVDTLAVARATGAVTAHAMEVAG
jgi:ketosteroid isomerase-like protein